MIGIGQLQIYRSDRNICVYSLLELLEVIVHFLTDFINHGMTKIGGAACYASFRSEVMILFI